MTAPRVGWLPVARDANVASARIRCLNIVEELQRRGHDVGLAERDRHYDVVILSKKYDAATLEWAKTLKERGTKLVFDLCDNHFHLPHPTPELQQSAERLRGAIRLADAAVVSTEALGEVVRGECGIEPAAVIGDAIEDPLVAPSQPLLRRLGARLQLHRLERWLAGQRARGAVPLVWFGAAGGPYGPGGIGDLARIQEVLESLDRERRVCLTAISNSREAFAQVAGNWGIATRYLDWNAQTIVAALRLHAIAVIPITRTPFTSCKSNNRVATALWHGLAVVADAIPSYREFDGAIVLDDWPAGLWSYAGDAGVRGAAVQRGRRIVEARYTIGPIADQWWGFVTAVAEKA